VQRAGSLLDASPTDGSIFVDRTAPACFTLSAERCAIIICLKAQHARVVTRDII